jgi:hypothetical protein
VFFGPKVWSTISTSIANRPAAATETPISVDVTEPSSTVAIPPTTTHEPKIINPDLYEYVNQETTWHDARDYCAARGGHLVTIQDADENELVDQLAGDGRPWLGATDEVEEGTWVWVTGEPWEYTKWGTNQPDNFSGNDPNGEDYVSMGSFGSDTSRWNDAPEENAPFVCEWESSAARNMAIALDVIQNSAPTYQTGFDSWNFGDPVENARVEDGKLIVTSENQNGASAHLTNFASDKFAVEFEFRILESSPGSECVLETLNQQTGESKKAISAEFMPDGSAVLSRYVHTLNGHEPFPMDSFDKTNTSTVRLIVLGNQVVVFNNGQIAYSDTDPDWNAVYTDIQLSAYNTIGCEFDNYKFWDLSGVDFSAELNAPTPEAATGFYEPILAYINSQPTTFEDDFSTQKSEWGKDNDGHWVYSATRDNVLQVPPHIDTLPSNTNILDSDDFAISIDWALADSSDRFEFVFRSSPGETAYYKFKYSRGGSWSLEHNDGTTSTWPQSGSFRPVAGSEEAWSTNDAGNKWTDTPLNNFVFIAQKGNLFIFVNGDLILEFNELGSYGDRNFFQNGGRWAMMDNFKFWDLSGVDFSTTTPTPTPEPTSATESSPAWVTDFAEPALAAIAGREPDFQDDFSTNTGGWYTNGPSLAIEDGVLRFEDLPCDNGRVYSGIKLRNYDLTKPNYVLQAEISPLATGRVYVLTNITIIGYDTDDEYYSGIYLASDSWGTCRQDVCTEFPKLWQEKAQVTLIVQGSQAGFYLEGNPVDYFNDPEFVVTPRFLGNHFSVEFLLLHPNRLIHYKDSNDNKCFGFNVNFWDVSLTSFDNVKFWDLDAIDLEP